MTEPIRTRYACANHVSPDSGRASVSPVANVSNRSISPPTPIPTAFSDTGCTRGKSFTTIAVSAKHAAAQQDEQRAERHAGLDPLAEDDRHPGDRDRAADQPVPAEPFEP